MTYLANMRYLASDNLMGYLRFATGYRPGGPNFVINDPVTGEPLVEPDVRVRLADRATKAASRPARRIGATALDAALYLIDWDDMQITLPATASASVANAGTARSRGAELTLTGRPTEALTLLGTFAYINAKLTEDSPRPGRRDGDPLARYAGLHDGSLGRLRLRRSATRVRRRGDLRYVDDRVSSFKDSFERRNTSLPEYDDARPAWLASISARPPCSCTSRTCSTSEDCCPRDGADRGGWARQCFAHCSHARTE